MQIDPAHRPRLSHVALLASLAGLPLLAHGQAQQEPPPDEQQVLHVSSQLVTLDVSVRDAHGRPVHGLPRQAFVVEEDKRVQAVRSFEEHDAGEASRPGPPVPQLAPGSFTNYTPTQPGGTLNLLLIDSLNTPLRDQTYLREQLRDFVRHVPPGQRIAIFGLSSRLYLLQGFTQDADTLRDAMVHRLTRSGSSLLDDPDGSRNDAVRSSDSFADLGAGTDAIVANLQQFESDTAAQQLQLRARYTLDALNALGHYLQSFSGRKNLIWFSGSFPINLLPDPNVADGFSGMQLNAPELRETTDLLTRAQVAVYPIDPRGLQTLPTFDAANSGRRYAGAPQTVGKEITAFNSAQAAEHTAMQAIAEGTGGHAFYNTNDLAGAVSEAMREGADYYSLTYAPTHRAQDERFRRIHVTLTAAAANAGYTLAYRPGYFAASSNHATVAAPASSGTSANEDAASNAAAAYSRLVLGFGAPAPQDILFQVHVSRRDGPVQPGVIAGNTPAGDKALHAGPFHVYGVDFAALPDAFTFSSTTAARQSATIGFQVLVYDRQGTLVNRAARQLTLNLSPEEFRKVMDAGIGLHMDVSVPAAGESFLRLAVQDVPSNRYGVVELSTRQIHAAPPAAFPQSTSP